MITVLDFYSDTCHPCKQISKVLPYLEKNIADIATVQKYDVDEHQDMAMQFNIRSVPTFVLMQEGVEKDRLVGAVPMAQLEERIKLLAQQEI